LGCFDASEIAWHIQVCLYQEFKTQTNLCHQEEKLTGENLKVVWPKFSFLSSAVFEMSEIASHIQVCLKLEFKTLPSLCHQEQMFTGKNLKVVWPNFSF
jgi:hypothetical protein